MRVGSFPQGVALIRLTTSFPTKSVLGATPTDDGRWLATPRQ